MSGHRTAHCAVSGLVFIQPMRTHLFGHEHVGELNLTEAVEEDGEVVVEIQFLDLHLPRKPVRHAPVVDLDRQVAALVESGQGKHRW